ncbi:bifunctional DNA primase/polymerase [Streptomyces mirabilis]|uniref:bifunctional DNA primase/polymerase n=1 Tax=Streptomyces mirabilis TaxID=68239 RepID=UPI0038068927
MHHSDTLRAVLRSAERGWHVFPLVPGCKRPAVRAWESRATTDAERLTICWAVGDYNFGIAAGPSRLVVVDLDVPKHDQDVPPAGMPTDVTDGMDALALLAEEHGERYPTETYTVRTPSGGTHLYFVAPAEVELRNTAGSIGWKIDTRAHGGYVVGAGSLIDDRPYAVVNETPPTPLPKWLETLLTPAPLPLQSPVLISLAVSGRHGAYLDAAVRGEVARVTRSREGRRNNALYEASVALGQLVAGGELDRSDVTQWLTAAAVQVGLTEADAGRTVASGLRAGANKPRNVGRGAA